MSSARFAFVLFLAACGGGKSATTVPTGSSTPAAATGVDAPAVSASGVLANDDSPPPVLLLIDAKGQRSLAAAASWKDVAAGNWSAKPKQAGDSASYMSIREGVMLGKNPKEIVDEFHDYKTGLDDVATGGGQDDPPPPEEEMPDDGDESGGTGTAITLEEGKMGKKDSDRAEGQYRMQKNQDDPQLARQQAIEQARAAGILGNATAGRRGLIGGWGRVLDEVVRQAQVQGEVTNDKIEHQLAVVIPSPATRATAVVRAVAELGAMIAVKSGGQIRPLHVQFSDENHRGVENFGGWLEVRVESNGLTFEVAPSKVVTVTWAEAAGRTKGVLAELRDKRKLDANAPVDVLVAGDVDAQHLVDVMVALDAAGVKLIGLGELPTGKQLALRGKDPEPSKPSAGNRPQVPTVAIGNPAAQGDLDKAIIRRYIKRNIQKIQYCYEKELLSNSKLRGTVTVNFFIKPDGKVETSTGTGVDKNVANCVAQVIRDIEFPKPKGGGGVQVSYPFTFEPAK